ncbi:MAG: hypothetical protein ACFFBH_13810 [Promethearchaeota archaeon]
MELIKTMMKIFNKRHRLIGYFDGKNFLSKNKKIIGYMENQTVKRADNFTLLRLDEHNDIFIYSGDQAAFILDSKLCVDSGPIFEFFMEKGEIRDDKGKTLLFLEGNSQEITLKDYFGIATMFLKSSWTKKILGI